MFLALLLIVLIPLAEGALFALLLRELYMRHPLPLGGAIVPWCRLPPAKPIETVQSAEAAEIQDITDAVTDSGNIQEAPNAQDAPPVDLFAEDIPPADPADEQSETPHAGVSVFDGTGNVPDHLPINNLIASMTGEASVIVSSDLENRIEAAALSAAEIPEALQTPADDMNPDHIQMLAEALTESLPQTKIDFSQELETDPEHVDTVSSMAKELLGENFDFDALEKQSLQAKQSIKFPAPIENIDGETSETGLTEIALDIQEDESGTVQVSSPFAVNIAPQLTDLTAPQTVFSTFSDDWIQETNSTADEMMIGDPTRFCFSEESRPMFVRRSKSY